MMSVGYLIAQYGYFALFFGALLEGETILIAAAFAAHRGYLYLPWVILIAFVGSFAGDQFYFFLGRKKGKVFLRQRPSWLVKIAKVQALLARFHTLIIVGFRFAYGFRTVTPFALGMSDVRTSRFVLLNGVGAFLWVMTCSILGYLFGAVFESLFQNVKRYEHFALAIILLVGVAIGLVHHLRTGKLPSAR